MKSLRVQDFVFEFPDDWPIIKYDDCNFYLNGPQRDIQGTKAVDILAVHDDLLIVIEATDLRGDRIANKKHVRDGGLALETAQKVRDTIAVLYAAYRSENQELMDFCNLLYSGDCRRAIKVVLVLEEDRPPTAHMSFKRIRPLLLTKIKSKLKCWGVRCMLHSCADVPSAYGWTVQTIRRPQ